MPFKVDLNARIHREGEAVRDEVGVVRHLESGHAPALGSAGVCARCGELLGGAEENLGVGSRRSESARGCDVAPVAAVEVP